MRLYLICRHSLYGFYDISLKKRQLMFTEFISDKKNRRLAILAALVLLDIFAFVVFDTYAAAHAGIGEGRSSGFDNIAHMLSGAGWILNANHISDILSGTYGLSDLVAAVENAYSLNSYILNKGAVIFFSCIIIVSIYRFAPDLLSICYGYLLGIALIGLYDGLVTLEMIRPADLPLSGLGNEIPYAIMSICIVAGGILALSKAMAYVLSGIMAIGFMDANDSSGAVGLSRIGHKFRRGSGRIGIPEHKMKLTDDQLRVYEAKIKELADIDTDGSIESMGQMYDVINAVSTAYDIDQSIVTYDIYKEKMSRRAPRNGKFDLIDPSKF